MQGTTELIEAAGAGQPRALPASSPALRLQWRLAWLTVVTPALGFAAALVLWLVQGVSGVELALCAGMYLATALGVEAGFHRYFSHRCAEGGRFVTQLFGIWGSMAGQGPILFWAALHRSHHAHSDRPGDPHSPWLHGAQLRGRLRGAWHAHVGWLFTADTSQWSRWVPDLLKQREVVILNQRYFLWLALGLALPAALGALLLGGFEGALRGALWGGLVRMFLLAQVTWAVNSLGHLFGSRPHACRDQSANLAWLAIPSLGGSWHNNHHAYPALARNDVEPWQIDPAGWFFELLSGCGLVQRMHRPHRYAEDGTRRS